MTEDELLGISPQPYLVVHPFTPPCVGEFLMHAHRPHRLSILEQKASRTSRWRATGEAF